MYLIDTHCHLTGFSESDVIAIIERARAVRVDRFLCIGASEGLDSARKAVELSSRFSEIFASAGVHPHDAGRFTSLAEIEDLASNEKVLAIGETGLDYYRDWSPFDRQRELFVNSIATARKHGKPLIIHCRDAEEDTIKILREEGASEVGGVFHCYSGSSAFAEEIAELNFIVSFTGNISFKKAQALREVVRSVPLERLMVETDCPYMAPEPYRGGPSEPAHVYRIAEVVAQTKGISLDEVARQTTANAVRLFGIY